MTDAALPPASPSPGRTTDEAGRRPRRYTAAEEAAFRACGMNPMYGPAQFAGGPYWPDELDKRADRLEALVPMLRLAADALRREIAADPLTAAGVVDDVT